MYRLHKESNDIIALISTSRCSKTQANIMKFTS